MKKILIITNLSGFLWRFELDNVALLQSLGYEVHFASNINEKGYPFEVSQLDDIGVVFHHIEIARSPYMWKMNTTALKQIKKIIVDENIGIIHCHTPVGALLGRLAVVNNKSTIQPKVIYTAHGFHFYKGAPLLNNIAFKAVEYGLAPLTDVLIVINSEDYKQAQYLHLKKGGRLEHIPGIGLDLTKFSPVSDKKKQLLRKQYGISENAFFVLSVGELNLNKNHKTAIAAIKSLVDEVQDLDVLYGICGDGYWKEDICNYAKQLGVENRVFFFGYQTNIQDYYGMADLSIFPSIREGLGMVGLESLAMGVPVVAADNRGTREYMHDGENGFVCKWNDPEEFKKAILSYNELSLEQKNCMKNNCCESVKNFDRCITHGIMERIYRQLDREVYGNDGNSFD